MDALASKMVKFFEEVCRKRRGKDRETHQRLLAAAVGGVPRSGHETSPRTLYPRESQNEGARRGHNPDTHSDLLVLLY